MIIRDLRVPFYVTIKEAIQLYDFIQQSGVNEGAWHQGASSGAILLEGLFSVV